jgi:putative DNA primase/helicase
MVALVSGPAGEIIAVHRTHLTRDGRKAMVTPVKASLGPIWGGAIRLHDPDPAQPLVIGEWIETSASAGCLMACKHGRQLVPEISPTLSYCRRNSGI